jgi:autotransporter translocation and assembly factor TamB
MKKVFTYLGWAAVACGILLLIAVVGIGLFTRTDRFRELLREQVVSTLNSSFRGDVSLGRVEGSIWGHLTLYDFVLRYQGTEVLRVPKLTASYVLWPLLHRTVQVQRVEGFGPVAHLRQDAEGRWNVLEALATDTPEPEGATAEEGTLTVLLDTVVLQNGRIDIVPAGANRTYQLVQTSLDAQIAVLPSGLDAQVRDLTTHVVAEGLPRLRVSAVLAYAGSQEPAAVEVNVLTLDTHQSQVRLVGEITNLATLNTRAELAIRRLATADLLQLVPDWPLAQDVSGSLHLQGPLADLHGTLALTAADARVEATWQADVSQEVPQYVGTVTVSGFDLQKLVREQNLAGILRGTVQVRGAGTAIAELTGEANLHVQALRVGNWQVGDVEASGSVAQTLGKVRGKVRGDLGHATWEGETTLTEAPRYTLALSVEHLNIKRVASGEDTLASDLNLTATVEGQGTDPQTMNARTRIDLRPSTIGPVEAQAGRLAADIAGGRVHVSEVSLSAKDATFTARGALGIGAEAQGQLAYSLRVRDLSPWLSLVERHGTGALDLTGEAQGNMTKLHVRGTLQATAVRVGENALRSGTVSFDLNDVGQPQPSGTLNAALTGIRAGIDLQSVEATVTLPQRHTPSEGILAQIAAQARGDAAHTHRVKAEVVYRPEHTTVRLSDVSLASPVGTWRLSQPAQILYEQHGVTVEQLVMTSSDQRVAVEGKLALSGPQDLRLQVDRLALATLQPFLPEEPRVQGILSSQVRVSGTAGAPNIVGSAELGNLRVAGQGYERLSASVTYEEREAAVQIAFRQDASHTLDATGKLPLAISWAEGWHMQVVGDVDARIRSSGLSLAFLNAFSGDAVQGVAGELSVDVTVNGPVASPRARGAVQLRDGQAEVKPLGIQVSAIGVAIRVDQEQIRVEQLTARAQDGRLEGNGVIALRDYRPERLTLTLSADRWPAINTQQYRAEIAGQVRAEGSLSALTVSGRLEVPEATLRPDLAVLGDTVTKRDETIVIRQEQGAAAPQTRENGAAPRLPQDGMMKNLAVDVTVVLPRNTWVKHQNANVELAGEVRIRKEVGGSPYLVGTIEVVRGWVGFQGRRFTLTTGQVVFAGDPEINPALQIVAEYRLPDYEVAVEVGGTARSPTLILRSEPELEQADILSLLLFGKPTHALGDREKMDLQGQALSMATGYAATRIGESVSQALGLEALGVSIQDINVGGGQVGIGGYVGPNTYVSTSRDVSGKGGREVSVEYHLSPEWKITTSTSADGNNAAGIIWHKQY